MKHLKRFNESLSNKGLVINDRIVDNIKDIFVEYQDLHELDVQVEKGFLPITLTNLVNDIISVQLITKSSISLGEISQELHMLIDYAKSLTSNNIKVYYRLDKGLLYYNLDGIESSHNTIEIFLVEIGKTNESFITDTNYKNKIVSDITDMFIELKDVGMNYLVSMFSDNTVDITMYNKKSDVNFDLNLVKDCVKMAWDYLSDFNDFSQFYRFGYVSESVTARMTNAGTVYDKKQSRNNLEYSSFPYDFNSDVQNKHALEFRFDYKIEGIKIVFKQK